MRRRFTFLTAALALLVTLAIPMGMWGQSTYTKVTTAPSDWSGTYVIIADESSVIFTGQSGTNTYGGYAEVVISNNSVTDDFAAYEVEIERSGDYYSMKHISSSKYLGWTSGNSLAFNTSAPTADSYRWVLSASSILNANDNSRKLQYNSGSPRFACYTSNQKVAYLYKKESVSPTTCATPTFSPAAGTYTQAQTVSISCSTEGATIYYTTDGQDPTTSSTVYSAPFNVSSNTTIKAMAAKTGYDNSAVASATYTFVTPMTIAEVRAQGTGDVATTGTVTSCVGTTGYIQDATAAICVYGTSLTVGDNISVLGTLADYNGLLEITNPQVTVISSGNTINPELMTIAQVVASTNQGWYIRIEDATVTAISDKNVTIAQGNDNVVVRFANTSDITFEVNNIISLNGNIGAFNGVQIANPQNVTVQENTNPFITADDVNIAADATTGSIAYTVNNPATNGSMAAVTASDWLTLGVGFESPIAFTCTANTATSPRTATVTLTYTYNTNQTVTKEVTVTQAAYEAPHVTWDLSIDQTATATEDEMTWTSDYATMGVAKAHASTNTNNYYPGTEGQSYTSTRFYKNSELTIAPAAGYAITSVVFTATTSGYASALQGSTWTNATAEVNNTTVTVTPTDGTTDIFAVIGGTCGFTSVTVYYVVNNAPSITANNVEITYDTDGDEIEFVINNPVSGGSLVASTESDWLEVGDDTYTSENGIIEFSCSVNQDGTPRTATVTLTYTYNHASVTKDVTVTQAGNPNTTMTIAEVRAQGTGDVVTTGIVTSCFGTTGYIQDATAAICVYGVSLTVGDEIRVSGTLSTYHGLLEIGSNNSTPTVTVLSNGNTVSPTPKTIAEINDDDYTLPTSIQGLYVTIEEATVTDISGQNTTIAQGENTIVVRGIYSNVSYNVNDVLTLDGNIGCFDAAQIANPQNVVVQPATEPSITVSPATVDATAEGGNGTLTVTYQNITDITANVFFCDAEGAAATYSWISAEVNDDDNVAYTINANDGEARTAYLKVNVGETYSNLVTINQAAYVVPPTPGEWVLTNLADLNENDVFVIVGDNGSTYAMSNDNGTSAAPAAVAVTVVDNTLSGEIAANLQWNINITDDGYIFYPNSETETWLYCTNTNNGVRVGTNENNVFTLSEEGYLVNTGTSRYIGIYNSQDWRCYTSINNNITGQTFAFYKKVTSSQTTTQTVALAAGTNWFSTNVEITLEDLEAAIVAGMTDATNTTIKSKDGKTTTYNGTRWRGALTSLDVAQMYKITAASACEIMLEGMPIDPASHPINIKANATTWIGFPFSQSMTVANALAGFNAVSGDQIKAKSGSSTSFNGTRWRGGLTNLEPGQGYVFSSKASEDRTLIFSTSNNE